MADKRRINIKMKANLSIILNAKDNAGWRGAGRAVKIKKALLGRRTVWSQVIKLAPKSSPQKRTFISQIKAAPAKTYPMTAARTVIYTAAGDAVGKILPIKQPMNDVSRLIMVNIHVSQTPAAYAISSS